MENYNNFMNIDSLLVFISKIHEIFIYTMRFDISYGSNLISRT